MKRRLVEAVLLLAAVAAVVLWLWRPPARPSAPQGSWPELPESMECGPQPSSPIPWREARIDLPAADRTAALAALRTKVPATEVPDLDVRVVYWAASASTHHGGFWLGDDRNALLTWEGGRVVSFLDRRATPDLRDAVRRVREEFRYDGAPVVPLGRARGGPELLELRAIPGAVELDFSDGWDEGCGHDSQGSVLVAPGRRVLYWSHLM